MGSIMGNRLANVAINIEFALDDVLRKPGESIFTHPGAQLMKTHDMVLSLSTPNDENQISTACILIDRQTRDTIVVAFTPDGRPIIHKNGIKMLPQIETKQNRTVI